MLIWSNTKSEGEVSHRQWGIVGSVGGPAFIFQLFHHLQHAQRETNRDTHTHWKGLYKHTYSTLYFTLNLTTQAVRRWSTCTQTSCVFFTPPEKTPNHKPGSLHSSARYLQPLQLAAKGPIEPQLSTLLSLEKEVMKKVKHISVSAELFSVLVVFPLSGNCELILPQKWYICPMLWPL